MDMLRVTCAWHWFWGLLGTMGKLGPAYDARDSLWGTVCGWFPSEIRASHYNIEDVCSQCSAELGSWFILKLCCLSIAS